MIRKINLDKVASFKNISSLETDKRVNLIYGLNGTGKSTMTDYLYQKDEIKFANCSYEGDENEEILVYNQTFIQDYFFEDENLKGIFTLSKENKDVKQKIINAEKEIQRIAKQEESNRETLLKLKRIFSQKSQKSQSKIWEIKSDYTGGDRVLEFCLEGLKGNKERLFNYINLIAKPQSKPDKSVEKIKEEVQNLSGENASKYDLLPTFSFSQYENENAAILKKEIVGNENSSVAGLIKKLNNSDWVKDGLKYLPQQPKQKDSECPFCQEKTINDDVIKNIKDYFNEAYENDINSINEILKNYEAAYNDLPSKSDLEEHSFIAKSKDVFDKKYNRLFTLLQGNISLIKEKIDTPSRPISLNDSREGLKELNEFINDINDKIKEHNKNIENKESSLNNLSDEFWNLMRWEYDQTIFSYQSDKKEFEKEKTEIEKVLDNFKRKVNEQNDIIIDQQKNTVNVEAAINNINNGLLELGINEFSIAKHSEDFYKIVRDVEDAKIFHSLSEGEKMIISFLYFVELCRGKKDATEETKKKIIVIDDPISSLSHIYVFNIGRLIRKEFLFGTYEQVFILTHSLYFFYELTDTNHDRRRENQNLFRLVKNSNGSQFLSMKYDEIQNDYQSYWNVIKDENQNQALIANCMRNIVEYFFNFIEKRDLSNVIQKQELKDNRYQAFFRYVHRESHSLGQNIFDLKEFNYDDFKDALRMLFKVTGYEEHYKRMMK